MVRPHLVQGTPVHHVHLVSTLVVEVLDLMGDGGAARLVQRIYFINVQIFKRAKLLEGGNEVVIGAHTLSEALFLGVLHVWLGVSVLRASDVASIERRLEDRIKSRSVSGGRLRSRCLLHRL